MKDESIQLLKELSQVPGIAGDEGRVHHYIKEILEEYSDEVVISGLGSAFGVKYAKDKKAPRVMIAGHMDEIGFMIKEIRDNGTFYAVPIGGWNPYSVSSQRYTLVSHKGDFPCVSSSIPPHLMSEQGTFKVEKLIFDAGFESKNEAWSYGIRPGDSIVPDSSLIKTANKKALISKAFDNRVGCALALDTLKQVADEALDITLIAGASTQEEVGTRGIIGSINQLKPDLFIALECSPVNDFINNEGQGQQGGGFLLRVHDPGMISHKKLRQFIFQLAEEKEVPHQYFFATGGTDASQAQLLQEGIPSTCLAVPGRYIHSHQSLIRTRDYQAVLDILVHLVKELNKERVEEIKTM